MGRPRSIQERPHTEDAGPLFLFPLTSAIKNPFERVPSISDRRHSKREKLGALPAHEMNVGVNQAGQNRAIGLTVVCCGLGYGIARHNIRDHAVLHKDGLAYEGTLPIKYSGA